MKPILFSTEMVMAILDGRKTQTRRPLKPQPSGGIRKSVFVESGVEDGHGREIKLPYRPGTGLWVRETWQNFCLNRKSLPNRFCGHDEYCFKASVEDSPVYGCCGEGGCNKWRPSVHMPKEAARIFLAVKNVWIERLQDITEEDAIKEGFVDLFYGGVCVISAKGRFHAFWDSVYAKRGYGWGANPWVEVTEFQAEEAETCQDGQG